jgi:putative transposase
LSAKQLVSWLGISASKYFDWRQRYGQPNRHNGDVPRDFWLLEWERSKILEWHERFPDDGYRRLCYMMIDADEVAVSPSSTYRVLRDAGRLKRWNNGPTSKGKGFAQPSAPHKHWHIDISHLNICGTFYYLCSILDGYSRAIIHWGIGESMCEDDVELIVQRALEKHPEAKARVISDNGPQFVAKDFKLFIRQVGLDHVRTSPYYPQSNGKKERWYKTLKAEALRKKTPLSLEDARRIIGAFVEHYNTERLHSAIGYVTPQAMLEGRAGEIRRDRRRKLREALEARRREHRADRDGAHPDRAPSRGAVATAASI